VAWKPPVSPAIDVQGGWSPVALALFERMPPKSEIVFIEVTLPFGLMPRRLMSITDRSNSPAIAWLTGCDPHPDEHCDTGLIW